jgi:photosystem II stability/assembly factor-like uncharacterized protein
MKKLIFLLLLAALGVSIAQTTKLKPSFFGSMQARHIGPATMSGRVTALDASNNDWRTVYVGAASGGIWKSTNGGTTFESVFDDHIQCIGALAIDQQNPEIVYAGTGEANTRNSISIGDGIYKTTDGGDKWTNIGLKETQHIADIIIHPENSQIVYVAALGNVWADNKERGVYKSDDGGKKWKQVLFINESTGCADLTIDPENPDLIYAGMWDFQRKPYTFRSGGSGSGLYKSEDGGNTWSEVTKGLPEGKKGRIAVEFSPADPNILYTIIESEKTGMYRSRDKGKSWELMTTAQYVAERPFYFSLLVPDPIDTNRVYKPGFTLYVTDDGGKSFTSPFVEGGIVHSDHHALWINPENNNEMYLGTDGGVYFSRDCGSTWHHARNLPISQFYHVAVDNQKPYNVYGGLQDNGSWTAPSNSVGGINNSDWQSIGFGDGFNLIPDLYDDNIVYWQFQGGNTNRFYRDTRESKEIRPFSSDANDKLRFNWNTPITFSPSKKGVMYVGSQFLFKSTNRGDTWQKISGDLTTNNPEKQKQEESGGLTIDNSTAENHCTIYTVSESPKDPNVIWVGTDDGNLQVTDNGGDDWINVSSNIPGLPETTWCSNVYASNHESKKAYVVFDGHRNGDNNTYVYKTEDLGKTWKSLAADAIETFARCIVEDLVNPNLLFLGTEWGLYVSIDDGKNWVRFKNEVPKVPIYQMVIHPTENDLVLGTHGRGILIIDNITPLRELTDDVLKSELHFFSMEPKIITNPQFQQGWSGDDEFIGRNQSSSALINYYMKKRHIFGDMYLEILDAEGNVVKELAASKNKGINIVPWPLQKKPPKIKASSPLLVFRTAFGPTFEPGDYMVRIVKGKKEYTSKVSLIYDPESRHSQEDRAIQLEILNRSYDLLEEISGYDERIINTLKRLKMKKDTEEFSEVYNNLERIHKELVSTNPSRLSGEIRLTEKIGDVYSGVLNYLGRPTDSQIKRLDVLSQEFDKYKNELDDIFNNQLKDKIE